jgi:hypothetical protein
MRLPRGTVRVVEALVGGVDGTPRLLKGSLWLSGPDLGDLVLRPGDGVPELSAAARRRTLATCLTEVLES